MTATSEPPDPGPLHRADCAVWTSDEPCDLDCTEEPVEDVTTYRRPSPRQIAFDDCLGRIEHLEHHLTYDQAGDEGADRYERDMWAAGEGT